MTGRHVGPAVLLAAGVWALGGPAADARRGRNPVARRDPPPRASSLGVRAFDCAWLESLGDAALTELVDEALASSPDLRAVEARVEAAAAESRLRAGLRRPRLDAVLDAGRRRQNFVGLPVPGGDGVLSTTSTSLEASVRASWELDLWGRLRADQRAAAADVAAREADLAAARLSLAGQVARTWFEAREAAAQAALARATAASYEDSARRIRARYEAGVRGPLDLRLALADTASARALEASERGRLDGVVRRLELLLGRPASGAIRPPAGLPAAPAPAPAGLTADLVGRRPDVRAARARVHAADERVLSARRARWPTLRLTGSAGTASDELADLARGSFRTWSLVAQLLAPLFDAGRLRAGIELAGAREVGAVSELASVALRAVAELETQLAVEAALADREAAVEDELRQAVAGRALAEDEYRRGLADVVTVLAARRAALSAERAITEVRRSRLEARIDLFLSLGGGFPPGEPAAVAEGAS